MGSGEGRANRPRSRHCNRRNAVSQDTLPGRCLLALFARKGVALRPIFSWGVFFWRENELMKFKSHRWALNSAKANFATKRVTALRPWMALFFLLQFCTAAPAQTGIAPSASV